MMIESGIPHSCDIQAHRHTFTYTRLHAYTHTHNVEGLNFEPWPILFRNSAAISMFLTSMDLSHGRHHFLI